MSKWKWVPVSLGIAVVFGGLYLWFFGIQTFFALYSRKIGLEVPIVKSAPVELRDLEISRGQGERLSFKGVEFEVPWNDVDEKKSRVVGDWALIVFRSGNSIILCVTPPKDFMNDMFRNKIASPELFAGLYGSDVLQSDYALQKAIFETTPSEINLLTPANRASGLSSVLLIKAIMPPTTDWAIYNVESTKFRGFQLGDPRRRPKKMSIDLHGDDVEIEINIDQVPSGSTPAITQSEINRIIQSAHQTSVAQPILTVNPA
jgi:hypothetical protein